MPNQDLAPEAAAGAGQALFENYLEFLRSHRGTVTATPAGIAVASSRPEFSFLILADQVGDVAAATAGQRTVHLPPWSRVTGADLAPHGFRPAGSLTFMTLAVEQRPVVSAGGVRIARATSPDALDIFSEVQGRGFLETESAYDDWHPWLRAANHRNLGSPGQTFYLGRSGGRLAGVTLALVTGELVGLYAVATLPEFRRLGVAAALMRQALADAAGAGCKAATLQVTTGSSAATVYARLGFQAAYALNKFERVAGP